MGEISRYRQRLSGPLLDRIDMTLEVARLPVDKLVREEQPRAEGHGPRARGEDPSSSGDLQVAVDNPRPEGAPILGPDHLALGASTFDDYGEDVVDGRETSHAIKRRVSRARAMQYSRHGKELPNAALGSKQVKQFCSLDEAGQALLARAVERLGLSARAYERIRKVARTIADLDASEHISVPHLAEAIQYRSGEERLRG